MTTTDEAVKVESPETDETVNLDPSQIEGESTEESKKKNRDFTKVSKLHEELAAFVNANSGLDPLTPNQVKAVLYLRADYNDSPEKVAAREARKVAQEAEKKKYEGMTEDQIKAHKAAEKAEQHAKNLEKRAKEAQEAAEKAKAAINASGEDLASVVASAQNATEEPQRRGIGNRRR